MTRARLGSGKRLSGERCGGCGTIGEEIVQQPPHPVFLNTKPGPTGTQTRKGVLNKFKREAMRSCRARADPETRRLNAASRLRRSPVQLWSKGQDALTESAHSSLGPKSSSLQPDPGQADREGSDEYTESAVGEQCLFVLLVGIGDGSYRAPPTTATRV